MKIDPEDPYGENLRVLEHLSLAEEWKCVGRLKSVFEDVLQNSPVVIRVKESRHDLEKLKKVVDYFKANANVKIEL